MLWILSAAGVATFSTASAGLAEPSRAEAAATPVEVTQTSTSPSPWRLKPPKVYGFMQVHYRYAFDSSGDGVVDPHNFRVQRVRLGVKGELLEWLGYEIDFDPRAPEVTGILRDAFISVKLIPRHQIRIGQQKTQFGYENRRSSTKLYVVNRSEVSDNVARGTNLRDVGLGLVGNVKLAKGWRLEDAITWVNGSGFNVQDDQTPMKNLWGRLGARYKTKGWKVSLGFSGAIGDQKELGDNVESAEDDYVFEFWRLGADLEVEQTWFTLAAEYVQGVDDVPELSSPTPAPAEKVDRSGYYVIATGKTPWNVGPLVRLDVYSEGFQRWTFGAYYGLPGDLFRILINYELRTSRDDARADDKFYVWTQLDF